MGFASCRYFLHFSIGATKHHSRFESRLNKDWSTVRNTSENVQLRPLRNPQAILAAEDQERCTRSHLSVFVTAVPPGMRATLIWSGCDAEYSLPSMSIRCVGRIRKLLSSHAPQFVVLGRRAIAFAWARMLLYSGSWSKCKFSVLPLAGQLAYHTLISFSIQ